ncbi:glycosyltransferase [Algoriphagus sanaruensis]|uniref:Glycosyltransferase 2-like domain-containing protein n=1 Tax=Algoriphagus sanaruensis TaxID=1727163 RepID=A0A142ER25_9BACT|nr:glycosyltransferase [Algoriphagus sanaruensis]AMQ57580.1 hypothetical protein AO498_14110 [Algoriphagus sanaruensis]
MVFQVLISSLGLPLSRFQKFDFPVLVIAQQSNEEDFISDQLCYFTFAEKGLSKSRNRALERTSAEIALISDDDVQFVENLEQKVIQAFEAYPKADVLTFNIKTPEGIPYKSSYRNSAFLHTSSSIYKVSSVEIAFRPARIKQAKIKFDEHFGLGAEFKSGEEVIFLNDCLKAGLSVMYVPITVGIHPLESSGKVLDQAYFRSKGAIVRRLYGFSPGLILGILFLIKQWLKPTKSISIFNAFQESLKGFLTSIKR